MADDVKGYVVRGTDSDGLVTWAMGGTHAGDGPPASAPDRDSATEYGDIATANMVAGMFAEEHDVTASVYRVYADWREERLPSYEEALAEIESLTDESAAGWAIKLIEEHAATIARLRTEIAAAHAMLDKHSAGNIVVDLDPANEIVDRPATLAERIEDIADGHRASAEHACSLLDKAPSDVLRMSAEIERLRSIAPILFEGVPAIMHSSAPSSREEIGAAACQMLKAIERALSVLRGGEPVPNTDPLAAFEAAYRRPLEAWRAIREQVAKEQA